MGAPGGSLTATPQSFVFFCVPLSVLNVHVHFVTLEQLQDRVIPLAIDQLSASSNGAGELFLEDTRHTNYLN